MIQFLYPEGKKRTLTFSYDDGQVFDRRLVEIFNKNGIKATFHLNAGKIGAEGIISKEEIPDLYAGHEVSCHGLTHPFFNQLCQTDLTNEILEDRKKLEEYCGYIVRGMSYPFGVYSDNIIKTARCLGIEYSRTVENTGMFSMPEDFMKWHPTCHHNQLNEDLIDQFLDTPEYRKLYILYVWGHSYEFHKKDNWDHIEKMCSLLAEKEDVWYATNIQIKDYLTAMKNIVVSVDKKMIYNPNGIDIWLETDGAGKRLQAGETWVR